MRHQHAKRIYCSPRSFPAEVAFEQALLVTTTRLLVEVDESENVNADDTSSETMYFEF